MRSTRCPACHRPQRLHGRVVAGAWVWRISPHFHPRDGRLPRLCAFSGPLVPDGVYIAHQRGRQVPATEPDVDSFAYWLRRSWRWALAGRPVEALGCLRLADLRATHGPPAPLRRLLRDAQALGFRCVRVAPKSGIGALSASIATVLREGVGRGWRPGEAEALGRALWRVVGA